MSTGSISVGSSEYLLCFKQIAFMCMDVLSICMSVYHMHAGHPQRPGEGVDPLILDLQMVVNQHVGAGDRTLDFWKSKQCSEPTLQPLLS